MTWLYGLLGLVIGFTLGTAAAVYMARAIEAENRELRAGLHWVRNTIGMTIGYRPLVQYIDRLLGDEAG